MHPNRFNTDSRAGMPGTRRSSRRNSTARLLPILIAGLMPTLVAAATFRCGGNTYTDRPCQAGQEVQINDDRTASQAKGALDSTREANAAAERMQKERMRQEAAAARQGLALIGEPRTVSDTKPPGSRSNGQQSRAKTRSQAKGTPDDGSFRAIAPGSGKDVKASRSKGKARRKAEG